MTLVGAYVYAMYRMYTKIREIEDKIEATLRQRDAMIDTSEHIPDVTLPPPPPPPARRKKGQRHESSSSSSSPPPSFSPSVDAPSSTITLSMVDS